MLASIVLDPLLIPHLGVEGAALASVMVRDVAMALLWRSGRWRRAVV